MIGMAGSRTRKVVLALPCLVLASAFCWGAAHRGLGVADVVATLRDRPLAPAIYLTLHVLVSLTFMPRAAVAVAAGLAFRLWSGLLWATLGCMLGSLAGFLLARQVGQAWWYDPGPTRLGAISRRVERGGWRAVAMLRLVPVIPHTLTDYSLGLTKLPLLPYAAGSLVGQATMTIAFVQFGAAGIGLTQGRPQLLMPKVSGLALLATSMALPRLTTHLRWVRREPAGT